MKGLVLQKTRPRTAVFCVGSPLQFLCAIEARARIGAEINALVIRDPVRARKGHMSQMGLLLERQEWTSIHHWPATTVPGAAGWFLAAWQASRITRKLPKPCDVYVLGGFGQLRGQLLRSHLRPKITMIVDDGTSTLRHLEYYYALGKNCPDFIEKILEEQTLSGVLKRWMLKLDRSVFDKPVTLFTGFDVHADQSGSANVVRHQFDKLKRRRVGQKVCFQSVFYFGSPFSEKKILHLEVELNLIKAISIHYMDQGLDFKYISHRDDSPEKLRLLERAGVACVTLGIPVELYFATAQQIPGHIASITSSALFNVKCIVEEVNAEVFPVVDLLKDERKRSHLRALRQYARVGIAVSDLLENFKSQPSSAS